MRFMCFFSLLMTACSFSEPGEVSISSTREEQQSPYVCIPQQCRYAYQCTCLNSHNDNQCAYVGCVEGMCSLVPAPQGMPCGSGVPSMQCDGTGVCSTPDYGDGCFGATEQTPTCADGCDDGNDCTVDSCVSGSCAHQIQGTGYPCGIGGSMYCQNGACCEPDAVCTVEGEQAECAPGSVCLSAKCWIACDPADPNACSGTGWPTCAALSFRGVTVNVCQ